MEPSIKKSAKRRFYPPKYQKGDTAGVFEIVSDFFNKEARGQVKFYQIRCSKCGTEYERKQDDIYRMTLGHYKTCQSCSPVNVPIAKLALRHKKEDRLPEFIAFPKNVLDLVFSKAWRLTK